MPEFAILTKTQKVSIEAQQQGPILLFRLVGTLDEDVNFAVITEAAKASQGVSHLVFDLSKVDRMNSCGVREWIFLMEKLDPAVPRSFAGVPLLFVQQMNMIPNVFGGKKGTVISFEIPYFCEKCNAEMIRLIKPESVQIGSEGSMAPVLPCTKCGTQLKFDGFEEEYFGFLIRKAS